MSYIPVHSINVPGGGIQQPPPQITHTTKIYSSYTGNFVQYGPILRNTRCDAQPWQKNYGKNYHVIQYNEANGQFMVHGAPNYYNDS